MGRRAVMGFIELPCLTGPALIRLDRVILVRPDPAAQSSRTLAVLDGGNELVVTRPAAEVVREIRAD